MAATLFSARTRRPTEVTVGADGVLVRRPFRTRFIPYTRLASIGFDHGKLVLRLDDGTVEVFSSGARSQGEGNTDPLHALDRRITEARQLSSRGAEIEARASQLAPLGRPLSAWREALRALSRRGGGDYRDTGLSAEEALTVLQDPAAKAERRLGAALLLHDSGHPEAAAKIRIAVAASASEPLQKALLRIADDTLDEATLAHALAKDEALDARKRKER